MSGPLPGMGPKADPAAVARVRAWSEAVIGPAEERRIMVTELPCTEPGCPPIETVIAFSTAGGTSQVKLHGTAASLTEEAVVTALSAAGLGHR